MSQCFLDKYFYNQNHKPEIKPITTINPDTHKIITTFNLFAS